jgi:N-acyl-D-aspartate/D-glutamate deacylase
VADRARADGRSPEDLAYDLLLEDEGRRMMLVTASNFVDESLESVIPFFQEPEAVIGLGDGGAHYGLICDASYPTYVLTHWARDRGGWRVDLPQAVMAMTGTPARLLGLDDRGVIAPGRKADINVIDFDRLALDCPQVIDDLPGGGRRLTQAARGYRATYVSGIAIRRDDRPTGELPGRLVRRRG